MQKIGLYKKIWILTIKIMVKNKIKKIKKIKGKK
jgi:hypothetical protein